MNARQQPVIYVLDDDEDVRESMVATLQDAGYNVLAFERPSQFLQHFDSETPAALVLDVRLPEMSGLELQRHLNNTGTMLPAVLITSHADIPIVVEAMREGAVDFLEKPVDHTELIACVGAALQKDAAYRDSARRHADVRTRYETLSPREKEVLQLVADGRPNKLIAAQLGLSERTVEVHRSNIMDKMSARSLAHLVRMYMVIYPDEGSS